MAPILAAEKKKEEEERVAALKQKLLESANAEQSHQDDLYDAAMAKGGDPELHSITEKLSTFADMANNL